MIRAFVIGVCLVLPAKPVSLDPRAERMVLVGSNVPIKIDRLSNRYRQEMRPKRYL